MQQCLWEQRIWPAFNDKPKISGHPPIPIIRKSYVICASLCNLGLDTSAVTGAKSCTLAMNTWSVLQSPSCSNFLRMRHPDFISHKLPTAFSPARSRVSLNILAFESAWVTRVTLDYLAQTQQDIQYIPDTTPKCCDISDTWHFTTKSITTATLPWISATQLLRFRWAKTGINLGFGEVFDQQKYQKAWHDLITIDLIIITCPYSSNCMLFKYCQHLAAICFSSEFHGV